MKAILHYFPSSFALREAERKETFDEQTKSRVFSSAAWFNVSLAFILVEEYRRPFSNAGIHTLVHGRFDTKSFRYKVVSIKSRFDSSRFDTSGSRFVTNVKSIRYKLLSSNDILDPFVG